MTTSCSNVTAYSTSGNVGKSIRQSCIGRPIGIGIELRIMRALLPTQGWEEYFFWKYSWVFCVLCCGLYVVCSVCVVCSAMIQRTSSVVGSFQSCWLSCRLVCTKTIPNKKKPILFPQLLRWHSFLTFVFGYEYHTDLTTRSCRRLVICTNLRRNLAHILAHCTCTIWHFAFVTSSKGTKLCIIPRFVSSQQVNCSIVVVVGCFDYFVCFLLLN